jgi:hypothetical protein
MGQIINFPYYEKQQPVSFIFEYPGSFRFGPHGNVILGLQPPWAVKIDIALRKEVQRRLICSHSNPSLDQLKPQSGDALAQGRMVLAVSAANGLLAVGCNLDEVTLHVIDSTLKDEIACWKLPAPIHDIAWSKHGELLAVLFFTPGDPHGTNSQGASVKAEARPSGPTIAVYEIPGNRELVRFQTGSYSAKVVFDGGGTSLFAFGDSPGINDGPGKGKQPRLCEFQARTGRLLRDYDVEGSGPGQNFAISPDGKLIAVRTADPIFPPSFTEQVSTTMHSGFVLLDAETGSEVGSDSRKTLTATHALPLLFTNDGKLLLVGYESSRGGGDYGEVVAYSVETVARPAAAP